MFFRAGVALTSPRCTSKQTSLSALLGTVPNEHRQKRFVGPTSVIWSVRLPHTHLLRKRVHSSCVRSLSCTNKQDSWPNSGTNVVERFAALLKPLNCRLLQRILQWWKSCESKLKLKCDKATNSSADLDPKKNQLQVWKHSFFSCLVTIQWIFQHSFLWSLLDLCVKTLKSGDIKQSVSGPVPPLVETRRTEVRAAAVAAAYLSYSSSSSYLSGKQKQLISPVFLFSPQHILTLLHTGKHTLIMRWSGLTAAGFVLFFSLWTGFAVYGAPWQRWRSTTSPPPPPPLL